jgi:FlaA1/EpsC-like NDP-sugar epimerase
LARLWKRPVEVVYTGLRPGEKLNEVLLGEGEEGTRPVHPLISHVPVPVLDPELGWALDALASRDAVRDSMRDLCGAHTAAVPGRE